jgi:exonuclease VII small subunit
LNELNKIYTQNNAGEEFLDKAVDLFKHTMYYFETAGQQAEEVSKTMSKGITPNRVKFLGHLAEAFALMATSF